MTGLAVSHLMHRLGRAMNAMSGSSFEVSSPAPAAWIVRPRQAEPSASGHQTALTVMALIHGNEVGGLATLMELVELIASGCLTCSVPVAFVVGNPDAGVAGQRYLESDLNRAFRRTEVSTREHHRARELEPVLASTAMLLDLHQTIEPTREPFFPCPFSRDVLNLVGIVCPERPLVTHWGDSFSADGMCTDEFAHAHGAIALTVELGQQGFCLPQTQFGLRLAIRIMAVATARWHHPELPLPAAAPDGPRVFKLGAAVPSQGGTNRLSSGLVNFQHLAAGEIIGSSQEGDLRAPCSGFLLFPKYPGARGVPAGMPPPAELCRIVCSVAPDELPSN